MRILLSMHWLLTTLGMLEAQRSAQEVAKTGVSLGATEAKLLQKTEELTLYIIALNKEVEALKDQRRAGGTCWCRPLILKRGCGTLSRANARRCSSFLARRRGIAIKSRTSKIPPATIAITRPVLIALLSEELMRQASTYPAAREGHPPGLRAFTRRYPLARSRGW
jgi:hypothetical protein